jgi:hypothetical protein
VQGTFVSQTDHTFHYLQVINQPSLKQSQFRANASIHPTWIGHCCSPRRRNSTDPNLNTPEIVSAEQGVFWRNHDMIEIKTPAALVRAGWELRRCTVRSWVPSDAFATKGESDEGYRTAQG